MLGQNITVDAASGHSGSLLNVFIGLALLTAAGLTIYGLYHMEVFPARSWQSAELQALGFACALPFGLMITGAFTAYWRAAVLASVTTMALVTYGPGVLCVVIFYVAGAAAVGRLVFGLHLNSLESALLAFALGFGLFGVLIGYAAALPVHFDFVYGGVLLTAVLLARREITVCFRAFARYLFERDEPLSAVMLVKRLSVSVTFGVALVLMLYASARESGFDALTTHFFMIGRLAESGAFPYDIQVSPFVLMPKTAIWGLSVAHILGGEFALRALHASLFLVTVGLVACRAVPQMGSASSGLMIAGFLSAPVVYWVSSQLFEESGTTMFITAAAVFFLRGADRDKPLQMDVLALACLGMAVSSKPQALFFGTLGVIIFVRRLIVSQFSFATILGLASGFAVFVFLACGPYLRAFLETGNPFHPFKPGSIVDARWDHALTITSPYDMVFNTSTYMESWPGGFSFQFLLLLAAGLLALLLSRWRSISSLALVAIIFGCALATQTLYARYQLYAFPLLMLSLAAIYPHLARWARAPITAFLFAIVPLNLFAWQSVHVPAFDTRQLLDPAQSPDVPIERRAFDLLNTLHGNKASVYVASATRYSGGLQGTPHSRSEIAARINSAEDLTSTALALRQGGITHIVVTGQPLNPYILSVCEAVCRRFPDLPVGVDVFVVDKNRIGIFADRTDAYELLGLASPSPELPLSDFSVGVGWTSEPWGWWSKGDYSTIKLGASFDNAEKLLFEVIPFRPPGSAPLTVTIHLDELYLSDWIFQDIPFGQSEVRELELPDARPMEAASVLTFYYDSTLTPDEVLANGDKRELAIGLVDIKR